MHLKMLVMLRLVFMLMCDCFGNLFGRKSAELVANVL